MTGRGDSLGEELRKREIEKQQDSGMKEKRDQG